MKILQFNIQFGCPYPDDDGAGQSDVAAIARQIRTWSPDIVFFQEVERARDGGGQIQPPPNYETLKRELPEYDSYFAYPPEDSQELPFGIGVAIFSKFPLLAPFQQILPAPDFSFEFNGSVRRPTRRILIGADIEIAGTRIRLLNTHLQAFFIVGRKVMDFPEQRQVVGQQVQQSPYPVILAGDFNSAPEEDTVDFFEGQGLQTAQKQTVTWHRMPYVLDHVFFSDSLTCRGHEVVASNLSDHLPLFVDLDLKS